MQAAVFEPTSLVGKVPETRPQNGVVGPLAAIADRTPIDGDDGARPAARSLRGSSSRYATVSRLAAGGTTFLTADPSAPHCRASRPHSAASASRSRLPAPSGVARPIRPSRRTWPSKRKTSPTRHPVPAAEMGHRRSRVVLPQNANDLFFAEPALLHIQPLFFGLDSSSGWTRNKGSRQSSPHRSAGHLDCPPLEAD